MRSTKIRPWLQLEWQPSGWTLSHSLVSVRDLWERWNAAHTCSDWLRKMMIYTNSSPRWKNKMAAVRCHFWNRTTPPSNTCNFSCRYRMTVYEVSKCPELPKPSMDIKHLPWKMSHLKVIGSFPSVRILFVHTVLCLQHLAFLYFSRFYSNI